MGSAAGVAAAATTTTTTTNTRDKRHEQAREPELRVGRRRAHGVPNARPTQEAPTGARDASITLPVERLEALPVAGPPPRQIQLSDFVGEHGAYQLSLTLILLVRYVLLGLMGNSGPLLTPDVTFYCHLPRAEVLAIMPNISTLSERDQEREIKEEFKQICQLDLHLYQNQTNLSAFNSSRAFKAPAPSLIKAPANFARAPQPDGLQEQQLGQETSGRPNLQPANGSSARIRECADFTYELAPDQGRTMTSEFDLVCDRDWLRSLFQSLLSAAVVVAHVFWGTFSDRYGRYQAQRLCLGVSLIAGLWSVFALDFWSFTLARALCSFGDLGQVVSMTTTLVELVGNRYRGLSVALVNFGYALGVAMLPYVVAYFEDFRLVVAFTLLCHVITMPFILLTTSESVRWLLTNRRFKSARRELQRIARWNRRMSSNLRPTAHRWPLPPARDNAGDDAGPPPKTAEQTQPARADKRKRLEQKGAFGALFEAFVEQIESQNLCDPLALNVVIKEQQQQPQAAADLVRPTETETHKTVPQPTAASSIEREPTDDARQGSAPKQCDIKAGPEVLTILMSLSRERHTNSCESVALADSVRATGMPPGWQTPLKDGAQNRSPASWCLRDNAARPHLSRTVSCTQLADTKLGADVELGSVCERRGLFQANREELNKMKRLTLPLVVGSSRATSLYGDGDLDDSDDEDHNQLRRRAADHKPPDCINMVAHQLSFVGRVNRLFRDKKLMIAVFTIVWTTFNSELQYTSFIIINLEVGEDVYLNYILGGCMEALAAISASLLLSYAPRRQSLISFWLLISLSCFGLSVAHIDSTWAVWLLALAKFSQSCLSSIASVAAYESFPTFLRQSGSGLVFTLGMLGSVFAPLIFAEFDDHAGMDRVLMTFSVSSLTAATLIYLFLNETRDCELQ